MYFLNTNITRLMRDCTKNTNNIRYDKIGCVSKYLCTKK